MKRSEDNITTRMETTGFVLIELLTAVAIIAILIGLLLPAIQNKREQAAAEDATARVQQAADAANHFRNRTGVYPQSLTQLVQFVTSNPSAGISIDLRLASGRVNGYLYEIVEAGQDQCRIEAEPEFPGITGSQTVGAIMEDASDNITLENYFSPGSDEAREQVFNRIRLKAAETVLTLIKLDSSATSEVRSFVYEQIEWNFISEVMDTDGDGRITIDEIRNYDDPNMDGALKDPLAEFIDYVGREMKWDSLGEEASRNTAALTTELEEFANASLVPPLFSYDGLSILTLTEISDGTSNTLIVALLAKLEAAEAAEAAGDRRGKSKAIKAYQKEVTAQIGKSLTRASSKILITISKTL